MKFALAGKISFNPIEQTQVLLFSLLADPTSILHIRSYLGLGDSDGFAKEIKIVKDKYGNLENLIHNADPDDFSKRDRRIRMLCNRAQQLKSIIEGQDSSSPIDTIIDNLFPPHEPVLAQLNKTLKLLMEEDDTVQELYQKFIDFIRTIPTDDNTIRIMSIMGSKGLDSDHVYVIGCNAGNIPGENRSHHLSDQDYKREQRRFLYVAFTRAKETLTITWSKYIPYEQSLSHHTTGIRTIRGSNGRILKEVGICEFLQDLSLEKIRQN